MIPLHLTLSGFLSYRDPVEIDFTTFDLACIAGPNGAGKSSLLDAITWALFGIARRSDDSVINTQSKEANVSLTFAYEENVYRVLRIKPRDKSTLLEFQIRQAPAGQGTHHTWKPLSERTLRETQARIESTLRLDYETFVNASFFLQGKADQFTQQRPGDRKRILSSILGLETWEAYRKRAAERRKLMEEEIERLDGRLHEIQGELDEEAQRRDSLQRLESELDRLGKERQVQEAVLDNIRKIAASLAARQNLVQALERQAQSARRGLEEIQGRLAQRTQERDAFSGLVGRAPDIEAGFRRLEELRLELKRWDETAKNNREHEIRRKDPISKIEAAKSKLEGELNGLQERAQSITKASEGLPDWQGRIEDLQTRIAETEQRLAERSQLQSDLETCRTQHAEAAAENRTLKPAMEPLKQRLDRLQELEAAICPTCGKPLGESERMELIAVLEAEGKEMGDRFRQNQAMIKESEDAARSLEQAIAPLRHVENELRTLTAQLAQASSQREMLLGQRQEWEQQGAVRLAEIQKLLAEENYAQEARRSLEAIDAELKEIGYDAASHDGIRKAESGFRVFEDEARALDRARASLAPLERETGELQAQEAAQGKEAARQQTEYQQAADALALELAQAPDLQAAEVLFFRLQENENRLRMEVGAARQKVMVLEDLKARRKSLQAQRETSARQVGQYRQLEQAFGKDGIPALLIEQALPEIEVRANDILERLSDGVMTVRFITQAAYKEKKREDLKETLDIQISDGAGTREYELYSGGEAFRVNFAVRLALSEILAQRAGARLQTLVIDEGFGSQDAHGRQRLVEAINLVRKDFAKILVITHIDELKDAFPTRIEVEKTASGSKVQVVN
jgi:DNA repair protein SbcC/Rad50